MIGWALRWVIVWCAVAFACAAVLKGGIRLPLPSPARPDIVAGIANPAATGPDAAVAAVNTLVYPVDARGHVVLDAVVNGAPVRFLVDTGASLVTLTPADARAAGLNPDQLAFNERASTANGIVRMAPVTLREIRLGQLAVGEVRAAVIENLNVSLLGVSFLNRLRSYDMRDGRLTITW
jgi:aspartyl protease family protein